MSSSSTGMSLKQSSSVLFCVALLRICESLRDYPTQKCGFRVSSSFRGIDDSARKISHLEVESVIKNTASNCRHLKLQFLRLRGGCEPEEKICGDNDQNRFVSSVLSASVQENEPLREEKVKAADAAAGDTQSITKIKLDMHAIVHMTKTGECLKFQAGEFQFDETIEIDRCLNFSHARPTLPKDINAVQEAIESATNNSSQPIAATTVVRIWGHWSFLNATSGTVSNLTTVATSREANYPTLDILGGPWTFTFCGLRSVGGTAVLVYADGHARIARCSVGSLLGFAKAAYGVTGTDASVVSVRETLFQRCRFAGARFVRQARAEVLDCAFDRCVLQGAKNLRPHNQERSRPSATPGAEPP